MSVSTNIFAQEKIFSRPTSPVGDGPALLVWQRALVAGAVPVGEVGVDAAAGPHGQGVRHPAQLSHPPSLSPHYPDPVTVLALSWHYLGTI